MNNQAKAVDVKSKPYSRMILVLVMSLGSFTTTMTVTMLLNAFPNLMSAFNISADTVEWLTNGSMLVLGVMVPISAFLINKVPTKTLYLSALVFFNVGLAMSAVSPNFATLLTGRLIAAVGVGVMAPLMQTTLLVIFPVEERGMAMGLNGLVVALAPAVGPTLSGWLLLHYSWRMLFWAILLLGVLVFVLALFTMRNVLPNTAASLDVISVIESTLGFGLLLYAFTEVGTWGWTSIEFFTYLIISLLVILLFGYRQLKLDKPVLDLSVLKSKKFTLSIIIVAINYAAMIGVQTLFTLYIQQVRGESAFHAGLLLFPGAIAVAITSLISGRTFDRLGAKGMGVAGFTLLIVGSLAMTQLDARSSLVVIMTLYAVRMIGIGLVLMPITTSGMNELPINKMGDGTSVNNTLRQIAGAVGTAVLMSILTNQAKQNLPGKHVLKATPLKYKHLADNAVLTGYHTAFLVCALFCILGLVLVMFLSNNKQQKEGEQA